MQDRKSVIIAKFKKAVPSFKYTDVLHGTTIGSGAFGTVKLGYKGLLLNVFVTNPRINIYLQKYWYIVKCQEMLTSPFLWHD